MNKVSLYIDKNMSFCLCCCFCVLMAVLTLSTTTYAPWIGQVFFADQGWHLAIGRWIDQGLIPYKDIFEMKGLFYFFVQYIGMKIAGPQGVWVIETFLLSVGYIYLYKYVRLYLPNLWALLSVFICVLLFQPLNYAGDTTESIAFSFVLVSAYYLQNSIKNEQQLSLGQLLVVSFCFVILMHIKLNYCCYICILGLFWVIMSLKQKQCRLLLRALGVLLCGFVVFNLPFGGYLYYHDAFEEFIDVYFVYGFEYSGMISLFDKMVTFARVIWIWLCKSLLFIAPLVVFLGYKYWTDNRNAFFLFVSFVFSAVFTIGLSGYLYEHYRIIIVWQVAFFLAVFCYLLFNKGWWGRVMSIIFLVSFTSFSLADWGNYYLEEVREESVLLSTPRDLAEKVNARLSNDDNIVMIGCPPVTYYWCDRPLAVKYGAFQEMIFMARPQAEVDFYEQINEGKCDAILCSAHYYDVLKERIDMNAYQCEYIEDGYVLVY